MGLKINVSKTKVMQSSEAYLRIDGVDLKDVVYSYVLLEPGSECPPQSVAGDCSSKECRVEKIL